MWTAFPTPPSANTYVRVSRLPLAGRWPGATILAPNSEGASADLLEAWPGGAGPPPKRKAVGGFPFPLGDCPADRPLSLIRQLPPGCFVARPSCAAEALQATASVGEAELKRLLLANHAQVQELAFEARVASGTPSVSAPPPSRTPLLLLIEMPSVLSGRSFSPKALLETPNQQELFISTHLKAGWTVTNFHFWGNKNGIKMGQKWVKNG